VNVAFTSVFAPFDQISAADKKKGNKKGKKGKGKRKGKKHKGKGKKKKTVEAEEIVLTPAEFVNDTAAFALLEDSFIVNRNTSVNRRILGLNAVRRTA